MDTLSIVISVLGAIGTAFGIYSGIKNGKHNDAKENEMAGRMLGQMTSDIGFIKAMMEDFKHRLEKIESQQGDLLARVVKVEESCKSAHKRLDEMGAGHYPDKDK